MAVDLVNTFDVSDGTDTLATLDDLNDFLAQYKRNWHEEDWYPGEPDADDLKQVRLLRDRLRGVFAAGNEREAAGRLNEILSDFAATPRISVHSADPHIHFEPLEDGTASWLGAAAAMGVSVALVDGGLERFGVCLADSCSDVFVDVSKNRSRKHCSNTCTTRENVAAYRKRKSETT